MSAINFVRDRQKKLGKTQQADLRILRIVAIVLAVIALIAAIVVGVHFYFARQVQQIQSTATQLEAQILSDESNESTIVILTHKLRAISLIMKARSIRQEAYDYFNDVFGSQVLIEGLRFEEKENKQLLSFDVLSPNVFVLEGVLSQLKDEELQRLYPDVRTGNLERTENGNYVLSIVVPLE